jgi:hypothetical protein
LNVRLTWDWTGIAFWAALAFTWPAIAMAHSQTQPSTPPQTTTHTSSSLARKRAKSIKYVNTKYGFSFLLPRTWKGFSIVPATWEGRTETESQGEVVVERGPEIAIINPQSTPSEPHQDIDIMIFTHAQWNSLRQDKFFISAAPIGPSDMGQNRKYMFATPPRMINDSLFGCEEVIKLLQTHPLHAF